MAIKKQTLSVANRFMLCLMTFSILFQILFPSYAFALTGGPSQPEVQSFEPVGTSDMVDFFSGDFNYNIPLMDVDGYPINIAYHSGITMDQEASWVGLGWNINPGVINRNMRGLPDDFSGDEVVKEMNMKPNRTYGLNVGAGLELFGAEKLKLGINYSIGIRYNNYNGIGIEKSLNLSLSAGKAGSSPLSGGLGITSSNDEGLTLQPSLSFSARISNTNKKENYLGISVGSAFNSRAGLKALSIGSDITTKKSMMGEDKTGTAKAGEEQASSSFDFGMPTFTPQAGLPMQNLSVTANFKMGSELIGLHPHFSVGGYYSVQKLATHTVTHKAYGYMNADEGTIHHDALMDFNREEKTSTFTSNTPALPATNFTYDIYSVSGQGVGGSYRPFRSDLGQVFDPTTNTTSDGYSIGAEIGIGNLGHIGANINVNNVTTTAGRWSDGNLAASRLTHKTETGDPLYERYYLKEANEKSVDADPAFFKNAGYVDPKSVHLNQLAKFKTIADNSYAEGGIIPEDNYRKKRERRSQNISIITREELNKGFGVEGTQINANLYANAPNHHIAEITTLKEDGTRYVYGVAAYNTKQEETTFAVEAKIYNEKGHTYDPNSGLVSYTPGTDNSIDNRMGLDNYYSNTIMPPYAHSYLLTALLSPEYVDSDEIPGISDGDIGNYTKFNYIKIPGYKWRVPFDKNLATHNEGLKSDAQDDKANYLYGEKELYYLQSIETKNHIAIFELGDREDGCGVTDKNGGIDPAKTMKLLKKISLYSKPDYKQNGLTAAIPIKEAHFVYDYSLCPKIPNNKNGGGKLTLKSLYFTFQKSNKARLSPYRFNYNHPEYPYNIKGYDRWGNYKPNTATSLDALSQSIPTAEYPYVEQDRISADAYSSAWTLNEIQVPSGGKISIDYESDDYAFVQNKRAMQMFKIVDPSDPSIKSKNISSPDERLYFKLQPEITNTKEYFEGINNLYFRFLMEIAPGKFEYVSGYASIEETGIDGDYGYIKLKRAYLKENKNGSSVNPIVKAAIQYGRLNTPKLVWSQPDVGTDPSFGKELLQALLKSSFVKNIGEAVSGPNQTIFDKDYCKNAVLGKSWIRLNNPNKHKVGGGCRVKKIETNDEWSSMTDNTADSFSYGQEYSYDLEDGSSSGVASYEPQLGGDENPWKRPVFFDAEKLLAPDDEHYMEEPFGESFFPSPSVGYSCVTVKNLQYKDVKHNATGKVVHEFYTAKDFPTITNHTSLSAKREKNNSASILSLLKIKVKDYMTASQGFSIELNDMHGKPKKQAVYQQGQTTPITSLEYKYQSLPYLDPAGNLEKSFKLENKCKVIYANGKTESTDIGVFFDFVADTREHLSETSSAGISPNIDAFMASIIPLAIPSIFPSIANEKNRFRSMVLTKVIQRFGILEETIAKDLGSTVATKNLAYDAETGAVLLTQTGTNFNDAIYSLTYPAHWYYEGMGPASKNIDFYKTDVLITSGRLSMTNAGHYFAEGDVLELTSPIQSLKAWVLEVYPDNIMVIDALGNPVSGTFDLKVIRSGRTNQHSQPMATMTSLSNPLNNIQSSIFENIIQAEAIEYTNRWKTFCNCFEDTIRKTTNPYILGIKGNYKLKKHWLHLTGRAQSNYNNNTNIRKDGVFTSYSPFYKVNANRWKIDDKDWTYTSEVTEYSPFGPELENRDALGRYAAATYGYNQTLPTAVAANSRYRDMGADNFEDYDFSKCADSHFKFPANSIVIDKTEAHTGRRSIRVSKDKPAILTKQIEKCNTSVCDIKIGIKYDNVLKVIVITATGGTAPYNFDWKISQGTVTLSDDGTSLLLSNFYCWDWIDLTVTDKNNCRTTYKYQEPCANPPK